MELFGSSIVLVEDADAWEAAAGRWRRAGLFPQALVVERGPSTTAAAHVRAWQRTLFQPEPTLIVGPRATPGPGFPASVARVAAAMADEPWHVLHLDHGQAGEAYVLTAAGAELLLEHASLEPTVAEAMAGVGPLEIHAVEPAIVHGSPGETIDGEPAPGDLERLLGYRGALPSGSELVAVGPEMVALPFWTPEFCSLVVRSAEALDAWAADDLDPVPGHEVSLALVSPRLFAHVEDHVAAAVVPVLREQWPTLEFHGLRDAFVIRYTAGDAEGLRLHHDVAQVSGSVKLNDGYEGGELVFPRQEVGNGGVPVGSLLAWPSLVTHPHAAEPVTAGVKYGLTIWFEVPGPHED